MEGLAYKIYDRDDNQSIFVKSSSDGMEIAKVFENHIPRQGMMAVLVRCVIDEEEIISTKEVERGSLDYLATRLDQLGLEKAAIKEVIKIAKDYKYRKCDEFKRTAIDYADRYIEMKPEKMKALKNHLSGLPHPCD